MIEPTYIEELKEIPTLQEYESFTEELSELLTQESPKKTVYVRLFRDDECTVEISYGTYKAVKINTSKEHWEFSDDTYSNLIEIHFPQCNCETSQTVRGFGMSFQEKGELIFRGTLSSPLAIFNYITPTFAKGALNIGVDKFNKLNP